jgi:phosphatidylcholine synthase
VHLYTASGSVLALLIVIAALDGNATLALWLGLATLVIDGTDGMLARRFRVKETIPWFDGARLDDIVDYLTYAFAPIVLLWTTGRLPDGPVGWVLAALPLLASSYQFCRVDAKTSDHFFLGFPSYWNIVAFYAIVLDVSPTVVGITLAVLAVLVFVPVRYVYPSRTRFLQGATLAFTAVWLATYALLLVQQPDPHPVVVALSLGYIAYYWGLSFYLTARGAAQRRRASLQAGQGG